MLNQNALVTKSWLFSFLLLKRFGVIFFLCLCFVMKSQDEIITKEYQYDPDPDLRITRIYKDSIYYRSHNKLEKIATENVIAIRKNYNERGAKYIYINPIDERMYGIKLGNTFFKADYRFNTESPGLSTECFLERYRVYDSIIEENKSENLFITNQETSKRKRIHKNVKIYIYLKDDKLNRRIKGKVHYVSKDTTHLILDIGVNGEHHIYSFKNGDIKSLGMEAPLVCIARNTLAIMSILSPVPWTCAFYYSRGKWYKNYDFKKWHIS